MRTDTTRNWLLYAGFWILLGLALALADYQDPKWVPGRRPWEPFFLEMGSVAVIGALAILVYRWVGLIERSGATFWRKAAAHVAGAAAFCGLHVGLTYAMRFAVYSAMGLEYRTKSWAAIFAFEAPKDLVTYVLVAGLAYAIHLRRREAAQREQIALARSELAELRLARLGDQLHPHFLFNCLNSIAALVEENPRAAIAMIARVGDFLRASLEGDGEQTSTLKAELDLMRSYLAIQAIRFEDSISAEFSSEPGMDSLLVPRLVLQPLIENAVKHNMVRPDQPLRLKVDARRKDAGVCLSVANSRSRERPDATQGLGKGLDLVRHRLALHYGDKATLQVDDADRDWFTVRAYFPVAA